ncbi:Uncharacterized OB-fold protein, contains Zn-ribbon domain [Albimonas donghaensis]|uniref:Uncharacterized OB-fold protein, contains Zn-ribbon domain n=1 Tax=Albimonas donghaensis TaxID=356660 RepID=A0A1H2VIJ7_9RHOB|nr:zinc ribbon domain-containing protein [Albimonas donghaensis]MBR29054.1 hypothetical protein [Paracoccaceae bacterium]SDW67764.1 Uncharacterized OB-fold protein, contains Zn-ribbon domain [Albimonas donghaensis]|tara:strand:+ start:215 stop:631 length:417 start_codon:yes stop_codon:yes gene_type:complete
MELEKPDLCALAPGGKTLRLRASRCADCGGLSFPPAPYGCPACGAAPDRVAEELLSGRARLLEFITIHTRIAPGLRPPVVVGEAEIAPGLIEEIELGAPEDRLARDMEVQAVPVLIERDDVESLAIRFVPAADLEAGA